MEVAHGIRSYTFAGTAPLKYIKIISRPAVDKEQEGQVYYCPGADSMAAAHGDDIIAEGEPGELDRLDEVSKRLVVVEELDRIRPGGEVHGQYLKRHILHIEDQGLENMLLRSSETVPRLVRTESRTK